uniref:Uncharacterized protein n=1 Tax=Arundo donax TaxID=35708 RepID=A0A0A8ZT41_ARUDO
MVLTRAVWDELQQEELPK